MIPSRYSASPKASLAKPTRNTMHTTRGAEMIDLLVQQHADVNARDRRGVTILANVMALGAADLADRLRSLGAN